MIFAIVSLLLFPIYGFNHCPSTFFKYEKSLSSLHHTIISSSIHNTCHECITQKSQQYGLKDTLEAWNCLQYMIGVLKPPYGCSEICLKHHVTQCLFIDRKDVEITSSCKKCLEAQSSKEITLTEACSTNCMLECQLPPTCFVDNPSITPCSECLISQQSSNTTSLLQEKCFIGQSAFGCREYCIPECGDGILGFPDEECDDGNRDSGDGCSSSCKVEPGYACEGMACNSICGDGITILSNEACDDGNTANGDGCSNVCTIEHGFSCTIKSNNSVCLPICGDNFVAGNETCDDGNLSNGDGCSGKCQLDEGYACTNKTCAAVMAICGDRIVIPLVETCDDGNIIDGDGCSTTCEVEDGFQCSEEGCFAICGDNKLRGNETCDDGNRLNGDGCSSTCQKEYGFTCSIEGCSPVCGDGLIIAEFEECDDGNSRNNDGCSSTCTFEMGFNCLNDNESSKCTPICGDAKVVGIEKCDDGNLDNKDGCNEHCNIEPGYVCLNEPCRTLGPICGDGILIGPTELCDDGNSDNGDGCSSACIVEDGFECTTDNCAAICGDRKLLGSETCDDGNNKSGDGCSAQCQLEESVIPNTEWYCPPDSACKIKCTIPRIRKSWNHLTEYEKSLYIEAVEVAMGSGDYGILVGMHYENGNEQQAHATCGFLSWHRKYLLAYENMLRAQGDKFACVTLPYWDYFTDYTNFLARTCTSIESCSLICRELGGSNGVFRSVSIPGSGSVSGSCATSRPNQMACAAAVSSRGSSTCSNCTVRGGWDSARFPSGVGYGSVVAAFSGGRGYSVLRSSIQEGFHNSIHSALGGVMATLASPADPIFFSHHATIDLAYQIHHKCHFGRKLSEAEKKTDRNAYEACGSTSRDGSPTSTSDIRMDVFNQETRQMTDPRIYHRTAPFFENLPKQYWSYCDSTDLGDPDINYTYETDDLLTAMIQSGLVCRNPQYMFLEDGLRARTTELNVKQRIAASKRMLSTTLKQVPLTENVLLQASNDVAKWNYYEWFEQTYKKAKGYVSNNGPYTHEPDQYRNALEQIEYIECLNYERMFGSCEDYTDIFRESFKITYKSRCRQIIDDIHNGKRQILIPNWQQDCNTYLHASG